MLKFTVCAAIIGVASGQEHHEGTWDNYGEKLQNVIDNYACDAKHPVCKPNMMCVSRKVLEAKEDDFHYRYFKDQDDSLAIGGISHWCVG